MIINTSYSYILYNIIPVIMFVFNCNVTILFLRSTLNPLLILINSLLKFDNKCFKINYFFRSPRFMLEFNLNKTPIQRVSRCHSRKSLSLFKITDVLSRSLKSSGYPISEWVFHANKTGIGFNESCSTES